MSGMANPSQLTGKERCVLELWDEGLGSRAVARQRGLTNGNVCKILNTYIGGEDGQFDRHKRAGSQALADAIRRHHPEMAGAAA